MKLFTLCLLAFSLAGCAMFDAEPAPAPLRDSVDVNIRLVDTITGMPKDVAGTAVTINGKCYVKIERAVYPNAITHEIMHCFSGAWHDERPNGEFFYTPR